MREYGKVGSCMWTRGSGKRLRGHKDAQALACYLCTCGSSNMIGLYYLTVGAMAGELGWTEAEVRAALAVCTEKEFAFYDDAAELVWIPNLAQVEIGDAMSVGDKRRGAVEKELRQIGRHRFVDAFLETYSGTFRLTTGRGIEGASKGHPRSVDTPSEGHPSPPDTPSKGHDNQGQIRDRDRGIGASAPEHAPTPELKRDHGSDRISVDDDMPPECLAIVETVRMTVGTKVDARSEWLKFCGHYATDDIRGRKANVAGLWQKWVTKTAQDAARDVHRQPRSAASTPDASSSPAWGRRLG